VRIVHVRTRLDRERDVVQPRRVKLERLLLGGLPESQRSGAGRGKAQVMDQLAAFALEERRLP
jgi:hypothetical protein